ncbi:hypothetical protein AGMMS49921_11370 [Endomicrobiia bacterium]|nr:hypothetical protein AGMMS49921_11370 [Endomicrobiia bacterium]
MKCRKKNEKRTGSGAGKIVELEDMRPEKEFEKEQIMEQVEKRAKMSENDRTLERLDFRVREMLAVAEIGLYEERREAQTRMQVRVRLS